MHIVFALRRDATNKQGGDSLKARRYAELLTQRGVTCSIVHSVIELQKIPQAHLVHLFNLDLPLENHLYASYCSENGLPYVMSTIHHPNVAMRAYYNLSQGNLLNTSFRRLGIEFTQSQLLRERLRFLAAGDLCAAAHRMNSSYVSLQKELLAGCKAVFPMTQGEANSIQDDVGSMTYYLIPNPFTFDVHRESNGRTGLLSVGRIEPRKNQLTLVRALRDTDLPLTVIGVPNRNHPAYLRAFYREVRRSRNVTYIPGLPQAELKRFYRNAKVHISLSWFEVVSQVDLEAIANGCAVVASRWGHVNEYVEEDLWQVDPIAVHNDVEAVRQIAQQAHDGARPLTIRNVMKWSWDDVTDELLNAYKAILDAGEIRA